MSPDAEYIPTQVHGSGRPACLRCQNEAIQAVNGLIRAGTWSSATYGTALAADNGGGVSVGIAEFQSSGASNLAQVLSPPARPAGNYLPAMIALLGAVAGIPWALLVVNSTVLAQSMAGLGVVAFVVLLIRQRRAHQRAVTDWVAKAARWASLFYCSRCNSVSDLRTCEWLPAEQTKAFWK